MLNRLSLVFLAITLGSLLMAQCPEITTTSIIPSCNPTCELCVNDIFTINLSGNDLPNGGKIEYYTNSSTGFNPYSGQGSLIGTSNIITPGGNCRICPELMGFMIDACGVEQNNEFVVMWTGSGFNTSNFLFDFASGNNTGGGQNADLGSGCGVTAGGGSSVSGCMSTEVGSGFQLPANAVWVVFTSSAISTSYDFSAVCGLGIKVYVSKSTCARSIGAFTNGGGSGTRTQGFSINGCACGTSVTYDLQDPGLIGDGDSWAGGISNNGCSAAITGAGNYIPAKSTITPFTFKIPNTWCDKTFEIVGIVNPKPDPMCCKEIFTERFSISVKCPVANKSKIEACDLGNGIGNFILEDAEPEILGSSGGLVEWFKDLAGTMKISLPYSSTSSTVFARIKEGNCISDLVPVELVVTSFTAARPTSEERCAEFDGLASFPLINLENFIKNGNATLQVKFFEDIGKSIQIFPPYRTNSITIYAITCKGDCESVPVPIRLIVNPLPIAKNLSKIECPKADGKASFDLRLIRPYITDSAKNTIVKFFTDSTLKDSIDTRILFRTDSSIIYAQVSDGKCSNLAKVYLKAGHLIYDQEIIINQCQEQSEMIFFDLNIITKIIQRGDTSIMVNFFEDSSLFKIASNPLGTNSSTIIYATYKKDSCISSSFPIYLNLIRKPGSNSVFIERCGDTTANYSFSLDSIKNLVNSDTGIIVQFYSDSTLSLQINGDWLSSGDTIYATSSNGSCLSNTSKIILKVNPKPVFNKISNTTICESFIIPAPDGQFITANFIYSTLPGGSGKKLNAGDTIKNSMTVYRYDSLQCITSDSFKINIIKKPFAGTDKKVMVCEGAIIDLSTVLDDEELQGTFSDLNNTGQLNGNLFNTKGLINTTVILRYTVSGTLPCPSDQSEIELKIVNKLSAGLDTMISLCSIDSIDLFTLLRNADPGGSFFDIIDRPIPPKLFASNYGFGQYDFKYSIGDGINCPKSIAIISIRFRRTTIIDSIGDVKICRHYILPQITGVNTLNKTSYFTEADGSGKVYNIGDTIFNNTILYARGTDLNYCTNERKFNITILNNIIEDITLNNLCPDFTFDFHGEQFDINNPSGTRLVPAIKSEDCDTLINISLNFLKASIYNLDTSLCDGSNLVVNGNNYDQNNPIGTEILKNASSNFCDSTIHINLRFIPIPTTLINPFICEDDSLIINGRIYNAKNSIGTEKLRGFRGCDSIVQIDLQFKPSSLYHLNTSICENDSLVINGNVYNVDNPIGTETLVNSVGCDSTIEIKLDIRSNPSFIYSAILCPSEKIKLGNILFDTSNRILKTVLANAASNGCDSLVDIQIDFYPVSQSSIDQTLCLGQKLVINNTIYDHNHPQGIETLKGQSQYGCDSMVHINLKFNQNSTGQYNFSICSNDSLKVGRYYYGINRTYGIDTLVGGSILGCDSITMINATILKIPQSSLDSSLCIDESIIINGKQYDMKNPSGTEVLRSQAANGCDSMVNIKLTFIELGLQLVSEYTINAGSNIQIILTPDFIPDTIIWDPAQGLSCLNCLNPIANPIEDTEYRVTLIDSNGCSVTSNIKVHVINDIQVFVPNVFSPNGDGVNDFFNITSNVPDIIVESYNIYNRWGELVYSVSHEALSGFKGWNGEMNENPVNPGVYVYTISLSTKNGFRKVISGDLTLIR